MGLIGRIGKILSYLYSSVGEAEPKTNVGIIKVDQSQGDVEEIQHVHPANVISEPLLDDYVSSIPLTGTNRRAAIGFIDPAIPTVGPGAFRCYSRDPEDKTLIAFMTVANDASIKINSTEKFVKEKEEEKIITTVPKSTVDMDQDGNIQIQSLESFEQNEVTNSIATTTIAITNTDITTQLLEKYTKGDVTETAVKASMVLAKDGSITIHSLEKNAQNVSAVTASVMMTNDGKIQIQSTLHDGTPKATVTLLQEGKIELKVPKATATLAASGNVTIVNDKVTASLANSGSISINNDAATYKMANAGAIDIDNGTAFYSMASGGLITLNKVMTIDTSGNLITPGTITSGAITSSAAVACVSMAVSGAASMGAATIATANIGGKPYLAHKHTAPSGGGPTTPPI